MSVKESVTADLKGSMKSGDKQRVSVLRMVLAEITAGEKAPKPVAPEDAVRAYRRKLEKARDEFAAHDAAKAAELGAEIGVVAAYLPPEVTASEVEAYLRTLDLSQPFGAVMKLTKEKFPKDGKLVVETLKALGVSP